MAIIDWNKPTQSDLYTDVLNLIDYRLKNAATQFPDSTRFGVPTDTFSNLPTNAISFRSNKWQYWNGASWIDLRNYSASTPEYYDIGIIGTASNIRGIVAEINGGTGKSSYIVGDLLVASSTTALSKLAAPIYGKVLVSQGTTTAQMPTWGSLNLQDHITSYLRVANGGTGVQAISGIIKGNGTAAFSVAVAGTDYAAAVHSHEYIPLAGGTLTGNLTVGTSSTAKDLTVYGTIYASGKQILFPNDIGGGSGDTAGIKHYVKTGEETRLEIFVGNDPTDDIYLNGGGGVYVANSLTAAGNITAYSDVRLKSNIRTIDNALAKTNNLRGVYFDKDGESSLGLIAQELEDIIPELVFNNKDGYKSVAYGNLVGLLIEAIKELNAKVEKLENAR